MHLILYGLKEVSLMSPVFFGDSHCQTKKVKQRTTKGSIPEWVALPSRERRLRSSAFRLRGCAVRECQPIQP